MLETDPTKRKTAYELVSLFPIRAAVSKVVLPPFWTHAEEDFEHSMHYSLEEEEEEATVKGAIELWMNSGRLPPDRRSTLLKGFEVVRVQRVENAMLYRRYHRQKQEMLNQSMAAGTKSVRKEFPDWLESAVLNERSDVSDAVQEVLLLHATANQAPAIRAITQFGLDEKVSGSNAGTRYGCGVYFANDAVKCDRYAGGSDLRVMFVSRVLLGDTFLVNESALSKSNLSSLRRPPCKNHCSSPKCEHARYDSISTNVSNEFHEFVVFNSSQIYPDYVVWYKNSLK